MPNKPIVGIPGVPGALGIWDDDPANIAAHAALTTGPHDLGDTWFSKYIARGIAQSGIPNGQACWFAEDFTDISRWVDGGSTPPVADITLPGGVVSVSPSWMAPCSIVVGWTGNSPTVVQANDRWYMACRLACSTLPGVGTADPQGFALSPGTGIDSTAVTVGVMRNSSTKFCLIYARVGGGISVLQSTIALDTAWHDIEAWSDGASYYLSVDGTTVSMIHSSPPTGYTHLRIHGSKANMPGARPNTLYDKYLCVFPQAA